MDERKRKTWPWIVATVIAVPVLYVASYGPWLAISPRMSTENIVRVEEGFYSPTIGWIVWKSPDWMAYPYIEYLKLWADTPVLLDPHGYRDCRRRE